MRNKAESARSPDIIVVGGGVIGLSIARELGRRGARVTLVERGEAFGTEASSAAAGMLAPQVEAHLVDAFFELACASRDAYQDFADKLFEESGIDIELDRTGVLYVGFTEEDEAEIKQRYEWQCKAGLRVELLTGSAARELEPQLSEAVRAALRFPLDGQVENRRLVGALQVAAEKFGVRLLTNTEVVNVLVKDVRVEGIETSRGIMRCAAVVVASGAWSSQIGLMDSTVSSSSAVVPLSLPDITHVEPVRGQMLCFESRPPSPLVRHVVYSPRCYLVPRRDNRLLVGATTEHVGFDKTVTSEARELLTGYAREVTTEINRLRLTQMWAGLRPRTPDEWPVIGQAARVKNLYYATGHYRNGILLAPITSELTANLIFNQNAPPWLEAFSPNRFHAVNVT